jgi:hypothetical protein
MDSASVGKVRGDLSKFNHENTKARNTKKTRESKIETSLVAGAAFFTFSFPFSCFRVFVMEFSSTMAPKLGRGGGSAAFDLAQSDPQR